MEAAWSSSVDRCPAGVERIMRGTCKLEHSRNVLLNGWNWDESLFTVVQSTLSPG